MTNITKKYDGLAKVGLVYSGGDGLRASMGLTLIQGPMAGEYHTIKNPRSRDFEIDMVCRVKLTVETTRFSNGYTSTRIAKSRLSSTIPLLDIRKTNEMTHAIHREDTGALVCTIRRTLWKRRKASRRYCANLESGYIREWYGWDDQSWGALIKRCQRVVMIARMVEWMGTCISDEQYRHEREIREGEARTKRMDTLREAIDGWRQAIVEAERELAGLEYQSDDTPGLAAIADQKRQGVRREQAFMQSRPYDD